MPRVIGVDMARRRVVGGLPYGAGVTRLSPETYLSHLRSESARFREVLSGCDPDARVPSCPDWSAADLLWHLATVQRWWAEVLSARPDRPEEIDPPRPEAYDELLTTYDAWSRRLADVLEVADPADAAWNWSDDHTVGFILRRQAHEVLVHRVDAELTAGISSEVDPALAADGVHEVLAVMYGGCPPWGSWEPGEGLVRVDATDTGDELWVRFGVFSGTDPDSGTTYADEEDFHVVDAPGDDVEPDVVVDGPAAALDLWLWSRGDDAEVSVAGDQETYARFRAIVGSPIN
ncbi:maleylpyruvate isomerase family mycothiol-dependent enzyme [Nocardioides sp.]|uniref:maleylpyruvate isomerase family mycothiol-dependent enzyme n=1 Tax=Nocardioides sp. TaxID=35761 RepID=UPI00260B70EE|nr:maleylpyruvate isomerase family mycothiol-dependent enzyme [Nocardioides sp.]MCW2737752.1 hypothetical protein [Nocardioides sp.]